MNMKKNVLMMTLLAGALLVSSCASKKDLENCRMDNQNLLNENKELNTSYQVTKEQLAAANARVTSLEEQLAQPKEATPFLPEIDLGLAPAEMETAILNSLNSGAAGVCFLSPSRMCEDHWVALENALKNLANQK